MPNDKINRVYITNNSGYTYKTAEQYGELVFLTRGYINYTNINDIIRKMGNLLDEATEDDYLCLSGNNFVCALALAIWSTKKPICKVLHWDQAAMDYKLYPISV